MKDSEKINQVIEQLRKEGAQTTIKLGATDSCESFWYLRGKIDAFAHSIDLLGPSGQ